MATGVHISLGFAILLTILALLVTAISFSTDHWIENTVDRESLENVITEPDFSTLPIYFTRYRGIFRTCYPGNDVIFIDSHPDVIDGQCLIQRGYEIERQVSTANKGSGYETRIHLLRSQFGFFVAAMLLLVVGSIMGALGCWRVSSRVLRLCGLTVFLGSFFVAGGMAFFHGIEYLEKEEIDTFGAHPDFPASWYDNPLYTTLLKYTSTQYGYSYILGWCGMGMSSIAAIMFLCAAYSVAEAKRIDDKRPLSYGPSYGPSYGQPEYPAMVPAQPMYAPQPQVQPMVMDYGGYRY